MLLDEIAQGLMLGGGPILLTGGVRIPAVFYLDQYVLSCFPHPFTIKTSGTLSLYSLRACCNARGIVEGNIMFCMNLCGCIHSGSSVVTVCARFLHLTSLRIAPSDLCR
jgi:hypothetical protein